MISQETPSLSNKQTLRLRKVAVRGWGHRVWFKSGRHKGNELEPDGLSDELMGANSPTDTERDLVLPMGCDHYSKWCQVNYNSRVWEPGGLVSLIPGNWFEKYHHLGRLLVEKVMWCALMNDRFEGLSKENSRRAAGLWMQMRKVISDAAVKPLYLRLQRDEGSEPMIGYEWDPGGVSVEKIQEFVFNIKCCLLEMEQSMKKCYANSELEVFKRKIHHMKAEGADSNHGKCDALVVKLEKRLRMVQWVEQDKRDNGARI